MKRARSIAEIELFMRLRPCQCGSTDVSTLTESLTVGSSAVQRRYSGACPNCGRAREFELETPRPLPDPLPDKLGPGASTLLTGEELDRAAAAADAKISANPGALDPDAYYRSVGALNDAITFNNEALELLTGGARAAAEARRPRLVRKREQHVMVAEQMSAAYEAPQQVRITREMLRAHKGWLDRNRVGEGRIDIHNARFNRQSIGAVLLVAARFEDCDLAGVRLDAAECNDITLIRCRLGKANLHMSVFDGATVQDCDLVGSVLALSRMRNASINGGDWARINGDRFHLAGSAVSGVSFQGARLVSSNLDEAVFTDCDFRGANLGANPSFADKATARRTRFVRCDLRDTRFSGRRLDDTVFESCRFHKTRGAPKLVGGLTITAPDLSKAGDGSDIRDAAAVRALWGV